MRNGHRGPLGVSFSREGAIAFLGELGVPMNPDTFDALVRRRDMPPQPDGRFSRRALQLVADHWSSRPQDDGDDA